MLNTASLTVSIIIIIFFVLSLSSSLSVILLLPLSPCSPSLPVPSVHCHIEFSQEFEHESLISNSCCSCVFMSVLM